MPFEDPPIACCACVGMDNHRTNVARPQIHFTVTTLSPQSVSLVRNAIVTWQSDDQSRARCIERQSGSLHVRPRARSRGSQTKSEIFLHLCAREQVARTSTGTFVLLAIAPALLKRKPCTIAAVSSPRAAGASEVSRSSCMKFLRVSGVFDFAGLRSLNGD